MTGAIDAEVLDNHKLPNGKFICGVVEGFYGRPWTPEQRKLLFKWMNHMGMNTYMYAPKDDCKHRAYWRDLYSVEEADSLTTLIDEASSNDVTFVYAISPGLDMTFSSTKDVLYLKKKLEQVATFGCKSFAILFDDIDPQLCESDKNVFQSFACAQSSVTNEVYEHLNQPEFMFCPTEYCASRAVPSVSSSEYLTTLGSKLLPGIEIMWTGPRVVSQRISIKSLEEVAAVLKRPPLIWDNIHANDYDIRRLFLGPYDGRSPEVIPYMHGVLTNPNCEFESNFIAFHTLSQWSKSNANGVKKDIISGDRLSPVISDIKLETESDFGSDDDIPFRFDSRYQPRHALKLAITDWAKEFYSTRTGAKPIVHPTVNDPIMTTCVAPTIITNTIQPVTSSKTETCSMSVVNSVTDSSSYMQPVMNPVCNSLIGTSLESDLASTTDSITDVEPMECAPVINPSPMQTEPEESVNSECTDKSNQNDGAMQVEIVVNTESDVPEPLIKASDILTSEELLLLVDLFYMPFEHGKKGVQMLQDLLWLKSNAHVITDSASEDSPMLSEWFERAAQFQHMVDCICTMADKVFSVPNKALASELFPYLWDMIGILKICSAYVKWLGLGEVPYVSVCHMQAVFTWFTKGYREAFTSGEQEPWVFRGGLQAEFQRLLPLESATDLLICPSLIAPKKMYTIRPYIDSDKAAIYDVCLKTCDDGMDGTEVFPEYPELIGDRLLAGILSYSPKYCFVVEDDEGVYGYCVATLDSKLLHQSCKTNWVPAMCEKYPKPIKDDLSPADELILSFYNEQPHLSGAVAARYPSILRLDVLPNRADCSISKRLLSCVFAALKSNGSVGAHCELNVGDKYMLDFYTKLGFFPVANTEVDTEDVMFLGRIL